MAKKYEMCIRDSSTVIENYDSLDKAKTIKLLGEACSDAQWLTRMVENLLSVTRIDSCLLYTSRCV